MLRHGHDTYEGCRPLLATLDDDVSQRGALPFPLVPRLYALPLRTRPLPLLRSVAVSWTLHGARPSDGATLATAADAIAATRLELETSLVSVLAPSPEG